MSVIAGLSDGSMVEITEGLEQGDTVYYTVAFNPWAYYGSDGDASGGNAWIDASDGDAYYVSDGEAALVTDGDGEEG